MRILAVGDLHGDLLMVDRAIDQFGPDALLCVGDWGDPGEVAEADLTRPHAARPQPDHLRQP